MTEQDPDQCESTGCEEEVEKVITHEENPDFEGFYCESCAKGFLHYAENQLEHDMEKYIVTDV